MFIINSILLISTLNNSSDIRIVRKFAKSLNKKYLVNVMCVKDPKEVVEKDELFIYHEKPRNILERIKLLFKSLKLINTRNDDVIQICNAELLVILPFINNKKKRKVIFDMHEDFESAILDKYWIPVKIRKIVSIMYKKYLEMALKKWIDICIVTTPLIKKKFLTYSNIEVIENYAPYNNEILLNSEIPIHIQNSIERNNDKVKLIFTGLINAQRGVLEVIKSLENNENTVFYLIGLYSNTTQKEIESLVQDKELNDRVFLFESVSYNEMVAIMKQMDVGVLPYLPYGNHVVTRPNKLFEYMMTSLPIICSNFPLYEEVVSQGLGISVNPLQQEEIVNAIEKISSSKTLRLKMGKIGNELYKTKYNWQKEEEKLFVIYNNLLGE